MISPPGLLVPITYLSHGVRVSKQQRRARGAFPSSCQYAAEANRGRISFLMSVCSRGEPRAHFLSHVSMEQRRTQGAFPSPGQYAAEASPGRISSLSSVCRRGEPRAHFLPNSKNFVRQHFGITDYLTFLE